MRYYRIGLYIVSIIGMAYYVSLELVDDFYISFEGNHFLGSIRIMFTVQHSNKRKFIIFIKKLNQPLKAIESMGDLN